MNPSSHPSTEITPVPVDSCSIPEESSRPCAHTTPRHMLTLAGFNPQEVDCVEQALVLLDSLNLLTRTPPDENNSLTSPRTPTDQNHLNTPLATWARQFFDDEIILQVLQSQEGRDRLQRLHDISREQSIGLSVSGHMNPLSEREEVHRIMRSPDYWTPNSSQRQRVERYFERTYR